jgi:acetyl esterase
MKIVPLFSLCAVFGAIYYNSGMSLQSFIIANGFKLFVHDVGPANETSSLHQSRYLSFLLNNVFTPGYSSSTVVSIDPFVRIHIVESMVHENIKTSVKPVLIWFHGGGFVKGSAEADLGICQKLANISNYLVVSVDYRLAPEYPFPAAADDSMKALLWVIKNIGQYRGDRNRIVIGGESAGGNLAVGLVASYISRREFNDVKLHGLLVVYPCLEHGVYTDSHFRYRNINGMLTLAQMQWYWQLYLDKRQDMCSSDYRVCPSRAPSNILNQFPYTNILLARYDILLDESINFIEKLKKYNQNAEYVIYNDTIHGFFGRPIFGSSGSHAIEYFGEKLRQRNLYD